MSFDYEPLDLNEIKKESKRVSEEGNSSNNSLDYLEKFVKLPERDGFVLLRILPRKKGMKNPWTVTRVHTLVNPTTRQKKTYHCLRELVETPGRSDQWRGDCIICKYYSDLWQKSETKNGKEKEDLQNEARAIKPVERYYYNVIVRSEKDKEGNIKKNIGPKIYSCGKTVYSKILRAIKGDEAAGEKELGDITHPKDGRDFRVVKKVVKGGGGAEYPNYDMSKFEEPSPVGSPDEFKQWMTNVHDLQALRVLKTPEELKHALRVHCGMIKEGEAKDDSDLNEFRNSGSKNSSSSAPSAPSKPVQSVREELATSTTPSSAKEEVKEVDEYADDDFMKELSSM
jgi:hypothetical protein